jgi:hypothetical protein
MEIEGIEGGGWIKKLKEGPKPSSQFVGPGQNLRGLKLTFYFSKLNFYMF